MLSHANVGESQVPDASKAHSLSSAELPLCIEVRESSSLAAKTLIHPSEFDQMERSDAVLTREEQERVKASD